MAPIHIATDDFASTGIYVKTPQVSGKDATISVKTILKNELSEKSNIQIIHNYINPKGEVVKVSKSKLVLKAYESKNIESTPIQIANPDLWSPDAPNLYKIVTSILDNKNQLLQEKVTFFEVTKEPVFLRRVFLCLDKSVKVVILDV